MIIEKAPLGEYVLAVLSAPKEVGHTLLSGATYKVHNLRDEPNNADDICLFLLVGTVPMGDSVE